MKSRFLLLLCLPLASVAAAKDFHFGYTAADLVSPEGLFERLESAVDEHCVDVNDIRNLRGLQACRTTLMKEAVEQIDHPQLNAYVESFRESDNT